MTADPFEAILMDMGYRVRAEPGAGRLGPRQSNNQGPII